MTAEVTAHCPIDDWTFAPRYTDGVCPLCGWRPEGVRAAPPLTHRVDRFYPAMAVLLLTSVVMLILVIAAYNRT